MKSGTGLTSNQWQVFFQVRERAYDPQNIPGLTILDIEDDCVFGVVGGCGQEAIEGLASRGILGAAPHHLAQVDAYFVSDLYFQQLDRTLDAWTIPGVWTRAGIGPYHRALAGPEGRKAVKELIAQGRLAYVPQALKNPELYVLRVNPAELELAEKHRSCQRTRWAN